MGSSTESVLYEFILHNRRIFQRLKTVSNEMLEDSGINASQRAVLEFLNEHQPQTVPQLARDKAVSRQHIQSVVNDLLERDLVECIENPAHKRSVLIQLTDSGAKLFKTIQKKEFQLLMKMKEIFPEKKLSDAVKLLKDMDEYLASDQWKS